MIKFESKGKVDVKAGEEFAAQVSSFRSAYDGLLAVLGESGTEVMRNRTLEVDLDIAPNHFVRFASHDFVFPPQPEADKKTSSETVPNTKPYTLTHETAEVKYDQDKVQGYLIVEYDDAGDAPRLHARDGHIEPSTLPGEVIAALDTAFAEK